MAILSVNIPDNLISELQTIATRASFPNPKAMVIAYLRATIKADRGRNAFLQAQKDAEAQADIETAGIA